MGNAWQALMSPWSGAINAGIVSLVAMHFYILAMPAPFDVYSWNFCFGLCAVFLFYAIDTHGFDWNGAAAMSPHRPGIEPGA